jgi:aspartate ammonia-lyase
MSPHSPTAVRTEHNALGCVTLPADCLWGIHTQQAIDNFPLSDRPVHPELIVAYADVKRAALTTARNLGEWSNAPTKIDSLLQACHEVSAGLLIKAFPLDALQGGAGTSLNMNLNEVITNRALQLIGANPGDYDQIHPIDDTNRFQSTNDTFPTALKLAAIRLIRTLDTALVELQEAFQTAERRFADIVKVGRTQYQDAVLITLGSEMGCYAEAINRDRWRVSKCIERLRVVNLGGTAVGTGCGAPRDYIFRVVDTLRAHTGIGFARAENLMDVTQNCDAFAEVSGLLKTAATNLIKICNDLRLLSSGPDAGLSEIQLPARQVGSSIMPGKINPVIPEAVIQAALQVISHDQMLTTAVSMGSLELNAFMPLIAEALLQSLTLLTRASQILARHCIDGIEAHPSRCHDALMHSTALATALSHRLGYSVVSELIKEGERTQHTLAELVVSHGLLNDTELAALTSAEEVMRLGSRF